MAGAKQSQPTSPQIMAYTEHSPHVFILISNSAIGILKKQEEGLSLRMWELLTPIAHRESWGSKSIFDTDTFGPKV